MTDYQLCQLIHFYFEVLQVENRWLANGTLEDSDIEKAFEMAADREDWVGVAIFSELAKRDRARRQALWNANWKASEVAFP